METTRRGLFQMLAAAFAAAGVPLKREPPKPVIPPVGTPQPKLPVDEGWIEIRGVRRVELDRGPQFIDVTSFVDRYWRLDLDRTAPMLICLECEPLPEAPRLLQDPAPMPRKFLLRLGEVGELRFSGWLRSMALCFDAFYQYELKFEVTSASHNSIALM